MRKLIISIAVATVAFIGYANSGSNRDGTGITPWEMSDASRAINESLRQDRVGPIACPKWTAMPTWKKLIVREYSWCGDWLEKQERTAQR